MPRVPRRRRRFAWLLLVAVAAIPVPVGAAGADVRPAASRTTAHVYRAFTRRGHSVFRARVRSGRCFTASLTAERRDAWRCSTKSLIYDPCFSSSQAPGIVLCPDAPWAGAGVQITLTGGLPRRFGAGGAPSTRLPPWALELFDGRRCLLASGATNVIEGQRLNYFCGRRRDALWGFPDRSSQPWTILSASPGASALTQRSSVHNAWM